jgi:hypothetical protein
MATHQSANHQDPTLFCTFIGGPRDGLRSGDLPSSLSGQKLTGTTMRLPLTQPSHFSLHAVYECHGDSQADGLWEFHFVRLEGPDGMQLTSTQSEAPTTNEPVSHLAQSG